MTRSTPDASGVLAGRIVLDDRVEPGRIVVRRGTIAGVELSDGESAGPLLAPGFVDVHVHGWGGHDAMHGVAALERMAAALVRHGVTSFLPTAVTAPLSALGEFADSVRAWLPRAAPDAAQPLGFNFEGPFISPARKGAQNPAFIQVPADVAATALEPLLDGLRLITIAPEVPGALELIGWLRGRGVAVSLGHSAATEAQARAGYAAGATGTTHLFNAMTGVDQHAPGLAVAALTTDSAFVELIADGHHVDRSLWPIILRTKPADRLVLVSDAILLAGTGAREGTLGGLAVEVTGDRCTLVSDGRLAGSVIAVDTAVRNLLGAGVELPRAVAAASRQPLSLIGVTDRGRIAPGQRADIVELDEACRIAAVMVGGRWVVPAAAPLRT